MVLHLKANGQRKEKMHLKANRQKKKKKKKKKKNCLMVGSLGLFNGWLVGLVRGQSILASSSRSQWRKG